MSLVSNPEKIRLAMLGMVEGNGHPYSWSAIINGRFDPQRMQQCGYPIISEYLSAAPAGALGIAGASVTHIWCEDPAAAARVAQASFIPHVVDRPEDVIGQVDAGIIATDIGHEHVERARPFIEAGIPLFIDKPLTDNTPHLRQFITWQRQGKCFLSTSALRYAGEYRALQARLAEVGELRLVTMTMAKSWERYGIHALEGVWGLLEPGGWRSVSWSGTHEANIMRLEHTSGVETVLMVVSDLYGGFGCLNLYGTTGALAARFADTLSAFRGQLVAFVEYLQSGRPPFDFAQTVEQMKIIIAGLQSRAQKGRRVELAEIEL